MANEVSYVWVVECYQETWALPKVTRYVWLADLPAGGVRVSVRGFPKPINYHGGFRTFHKTAKAAWAKWHQLLTNKVKALRTRLKNAEDLLSRPMNVEEVPSEQRVAMPLKLK